MARSVDSIGVQKQLNSMFEQRLDLENKILNTMQSELKVAMQLQAVLKDLTADQLTDKLNEANKALEDLTSKAGETGDIGAKAMAGMAEKTAQVATNSSTLSKMFTGIGKVMGSMQSTALGVLGSMYKIGKAILSIPLDIFNNLMADAAAMSGDTSFLEALEKIRKEFGSFKEDVSKNIVGAYKTVNTQLTQMSGLSVWQVFKTPADQLTYLHEIATKAGPMMHKFGEEMAAAGGAMVTFDKGMGIGAENMKGFMDRAAVMGTDLQTQLTSTGNQALQMAKAFGMSSKTISHAMGIMMKDIKNFGSLNQKEMATAAVYTRKLGIEMKDVLGVVEKFDNFDKAAESSALLSQAFGANVDAFAMMNEQNPAKRMDEMRKALAATGQTTENMTRQQLKLLASTTGLTEEAAQLAFSSKNQGLTYEQVQKQASKAESAQMTQAKVMKGLSDNIERVVRAGQQIAGFWNNFVAGFERGFKMTEEYRGLMFTLKEAMRQFYFAGMEVGRMFMKLTPGLADGFKSLTAVFSADKIKKLLFGFTKETDAGIKKLGGVVGGFKEIFQGNLDKGFAGIKQSFSGFFSSAQLQPIYNGIMKFGTWLAKTFGEAVGSVAKHAPEYIDKLTKFIKDPKAFIDAMKRGGGQTSGIFGALMKAFVEGFDKNGPVAKALSDSLSKLISAVWEKIKSDPTVQKAVTGFVMFNIAKIFASNVGGIMSTTATLVTQFSKVSKAANDVSDAAGNASKATGNLSGAAGKLGAVAASLAALAAGYAAGQYLGEQFTKGFEDKIKANTDRAAKIVDESLLGSDTMLHKKRLAGVSSSSEEQEAIKKQMADLQKTIDLETKRLGGESKVSWERVSAGMADSMFDPKTWIGKKGERVKMLEDSNQSALRLAKEQLFQLQKELGRSATNDVSKILKESGVPEAALAGSKEIVDAAMPKMLQEFDKIAAQAHLSLAEKNAARTEYIKKTLAEQAATTQAAAVQIREESEKQAAIDVDKLGLQGEARIKKMQDITNSLVREKSKQYAEEHKFDSGNAGVSVAAAAQQSIESLMSTKKTLEENINSLVKFAEGGVMTKLNVALPKAGAALEEFNTKLSTSSLNNTISATAGIVKSVNELGAILASGDGATMKVGEKLQRFANSAGLGKSGSYEIKNKGITLKLDLKIVMDAGEVEKTIVMRKDSILFDMLNGDGLTPENQRKIDEFKAKVGG